MSLIPKSQAKREIWLLVLLFVPLAVTGFVWSLIEAGGYDTSDQPTPIPPGFSTPVPEDASGAEATGLILIDEGLAIRLPELV